MLPIYKHTQFGWVVAAGTAVGMVLATGMLLWLSAATLKAAWWLVAALYAVLAAAFLLFATLTVEVTEREIRARFGVGLFGRTIPLADVRRSEIVRTRIWWGWGLHWTPGGWLYNVAGRQAVRLDLVRQRPVMIGSDDADGLKRAIDARLAGREAV
ncbi:MAG: hypothetical protein ABI886_16565 [Betaproteobacteria bacterium]